MKERIKDYNKTKRACYLGFVTQAIVANFTPLLFMAFHREYKIPIASHALIPAVFLCCSVGDRPFVCKIQKHRL